MYESFFFLGVGFFLLIFGERNKNEYLRIISFFASLGFVLIGFYSNPVPTSSITHVNYFYSTSLCSSCINNTVSTTNTIYTNSPVATSGGWVFLALIFVYGFLIGKDILKELFRWKH